MTYTKAAIVYFGSLALLAGGMLLGDWVSDIAHDNAAKHSNVLVTRQVVYVEVTPTQVVSFAQIACKDHEGAQGFIEERDIHGVLNNFMALCHDGKESDLPQTIVLPQEFSNRE